MYSIEPIIRQLGDQIIRQDQPFQFPATSKLIQLREFGYLIIHQEDILDIRQRVRNLTDLLNPVIGEYQGGELVQEGEVVQLTNLVIAQVDALEEV